MKKASLPLTRREFLGLMGIASLAGLFARLIQVLLQFARPPATRNQMGGVFDLGNYTDLNLQTDAPRRYPQGRFWLVQAPEGLVALNGLCTHLDCLFDWDLTDERFVCPCHGSQFDMYGNCLSGPAARNLDRHVVRLFDETSRLVAETDSTTGSPLPLPDATPTPDVSEDATPMLRVEVDTSAKIRGSAF
jgi:cytochrome b6-f complex iron-sulfur subunit